MVYTQIYQRFKGYPFNMIQLTRYTYAQHNIF